MNDANTYYFVISLLHMSPLKSKIGKKPIPKRETIKDGIYTINNNLDTDERSGDIISFLKTSKMVDISVIYNVMRTQGPIRRIIVEKGRISVEFVNKITIPQSGP